MLRRIEDAGVFSALFAAREWLSFRLRRPGAREAFARLQAARQGERVFLVGAAPSLSRLDLDRLDGEQYFLVNMAERLPWTHSRRHPYYIAADTGVVEKYDDAAPKLDAQTYFYAEKLRHRLAPGFRDDPRIFYYPAAKGGVLRRGALLRPWLGVASGQTILISAAQIAAALGFRRIYVIGCDLDYDTADPYAYQLREDERRAFTARSDKMREKCNAGFAVLRRAIEARGGLLANAGWGGRLDTLPRVAFASLF